MEIFIGLPRRHRLLLKIYEITHETLAKTVQTILVTAAVTLKIKNVVYFPTKWTN